MVSGKMYLTDGRTDGQRTPMPRHWLCWHSPAELINKDKQQPCKQPKKVANKFAKYSNLPNWIMYYCCCYNVTATTKAICYHHNKSFQTKLDFELKFSSQSVYYDWSKNLWRQWNLYFGLVLFVSRVSQVAEAFLSLAQSDVTGSAMYVSQKYTGLLTFPATLEEMIAKYT